MAKNRLQIFAKAPVAGQVKTRLIPALGKEGALAAYLNLLTQTLGLSQFHGYEAELWCSPNVQHNFFETAQVTYGVKLHRQAGLDLGERMIGALQQGLVDGGKVVLIGADCPVLTPAYILSAFDALEECDVALGPAEDGGFVLIACRKVHADMFNNVNWGTSSVLTSTQLALSKADLIHQLLPMLWDVDEPKDWARWQHLLR